jgi:hypothetical protein
MVHEGSVVERKSLQHSKSLSLGKGGTAKDASQAEKTWRVSSRLKYLTGEDRGWGGMEGRGTARGGTETERWKGLSTPV